MGSPAGGVGAGMVDEVARDDLGHLYAAMQRLDLIAEATALGSVARAARAAQRDLWPVIARLGGGQEDYAKWKLPKVPPRPPARPPRRG